MNIKAIYDNGGETFDRYTVYYDVLEKAPDMYACLGMSEHPTHPQGFGQHAYGQLGDHNGKQITFEELPLECQEAVKQDLK